MTSICLLLSLEISIQQVALVQVFGLLQVIPAGSAGKFGRGLQAAKYCNIKLIKQSLHKRCTFK